MSISEYRLRTDSWAEVFCQVMYQVLTQEAVYWAQYYGKKKPVEALPSVETTEGIAQFDHAHLLSFCSRFDMPANTAKFTSP